MKHGRNPTRRQKMLLKSKGLNCGNWLVVKDTLGKMEIIHRHTFAKRIIRKEVTG